MPGKLINNGREYSEPFEVSCFDCTKRSELSITGALRAVEHAADRHLAAYNMSYEELLGLNTVFLLSSLEIKLLRPVKLNETLFVNTWQRGTIKVRYLRDAELLRADGERVAECVENWFIADPKEHRIKRPKDFPEYNALPALHEKALSGNIITVTPNESAVKTACHTVMYSDLDFNHHMNNTRYADLVYNAVPGGLGDRAITEMKLVFHSEALEGDKIELFTALDKDTLYVRGVHERGKCFEAEAVISG